MSDFGEAVRLFFSFRRSNLLCVVLCVRLRLFVVFVVVPVASFISVSFIPSSYCTQRSCMLVYAQLVLTEPARKRVVYGSPVDILIRLAFHFSGTWNFNCAGTIVVRLSMFDRRGKPLKNLQHTARLTKSMDLTHRTYSSIKNDGF